MAGNQQQNPYGNEENPWEQQPQQQPQNYVQQSSQNQQWQPPQPQQQPAQGGAPGYQDMNQWRQWYSQQQGGQRPEDMARFNDATLQGWDQYLEKSGENAGKYRSMRGEEGYYDKPTECPPGMMPSGPDETDPCMPNPGEGGGGGGGGGGGWGGGGGGGGWGGGAGGYGSPIFNYLSRSGMEAAQDPNKAMSLFMGYGGAGQYQAQLDKSRKEAMALPEPMRSRLLADLERQKQAGLTDMRSKGAAMARGDLTGLMGQEFGYNQLGENARQANMQNALGLGNLGLQRQMFGWESGSKWADTMAENQANRDLQLQLSKMNINANQPSKAQKVLGGAGAAVGVIGSVAALL